MHNFDGTECYGVLISITRSIIDTYPAVMLSCCYVVLYCWCPVHPGRVGIDGHCHLHTPHSHHHCPPLEPHTPPQTQFGLADRDIKKEQFKRDSVAF